MPQKNTYKKRPSAARSTKSSNGSWLQRRALRLYSRPVLFALTFMLVGVVTLIYVSAATTTYGLWDNSVVPKRITSGDTRSVELGMRFKSSASGYVTGVRFYKAAQNTGKHTGSLWSNTGRLLATATFTGETRSGWQSVKFSKPVNIAANVPYIVSYHAPNGRYAYDTNYFTKNIVRNQLTGLKTTSVNGNNGVYKYSASTAFPATGSRVSANYWVDVQFTTKIFNAPVAPAAPGNVTATANGATSTTVRWSASSSAVQIAKYLVYRDGGKIAEVQGTTLTDTSVQAGSTYTYKVKAVDTAGTVSADSLDAVVKVPAATTPPPPSPTPTPTPAPTPSPTPPTAPNPATTNLFNSSKKEIAMRLVSSAENSSLNWRAQFAYIEDINDGRGYTAGIIGFCSGTGDMLELVEHYTKAKPGNILAKYLPALRNVNGTASHAGLGDAFVADWRTAANDAIFQQSQEYIRDLQYFNPSVNQAVSDGLKTLGQFIYYDAIVMHGPGSDPVSFGGIRATAMRNAKTPAQGGNEVTYLNAFLNARVAAMRTEAAHEDTSRVDTAQRVFLQQGNMYLNPPLNWQVYGDSFSIPTLP